MPGPGRARGEAAVAENRACELCHEREARSWRSSLHHHAGTHPAYRDAFAVEPNPFCRGCHVPEGVPTAEPSASVRALGVGCVTCHLTPGGDILAAPAQDRQEPAPHRLLRSAEFASDGGCAGCHEFTFPGLHGGDDRAFMQTTSREHRRSAGRTTPCASCHMPLVDGARSHGFDRVRDPAWLRENLLVEAERQGDIVQLTLRQPRPGHAFPTGDLFRRLEVGLLVQDRSGRVRLRERQFLARHFEVRTGVAGRHLERDDRVFDEPRSVFFSLPDGEHLRISWWVTLQRVASVGDGTSPAEARVESEVRLHEGRLP